jgi:hypothetical protein
VHASKSWHVATESGETESNPGASAAPGSSRVVMSGLVLQATSAGFAIAATVSFALFAQAVLVETRLPQFAAHIPPNRSLAGLAVSAAVSFALLAQAVLVFAGTPQFFALPASPASIVDADASGSNLDRLSMDGDRSQNNGGCRRNGECKLARSLKHSIPPS